METLQEQIEGCELRIAEQTEIISSLEIQLDNLDEYVKPLVEDRISFLMEARRLDREKLILLNEGTK